MNRAIQYQIYAVMRRKGPKDNCMNRPVPLMSNVSPKQNRSRKLHVAHIYSCNIHTNIEIWVVAHWSQSLLVEFNAEAVSLAVMEEIKLLDVSFQIAVLWERQRRPHLRMVLQVAPQCRGPSCNAYVLMGVRWDCWRGWTNCVYGFSMKHISAHLSWLRGWRWVVSWYWRAESAEFLLDLQRN